jgi:cytochrome c-type biogenesis protein CcmH
MKRLVATVLILLPLAAHAVTPGEMLADPALEARARVITGELRCLVCQNQSIDDSDAALAKDLRVLVREKLKEGLSDAQVLDYVHARYGDFVLLRPPLNTGTLLLWAAPALALFAGALAVWSAARRNRTVRATAPLTAEERERLATLTRREEAASGQDS